MRLPRRGRQVVARHAVAAQRHVEAEPGAEVVGAAEHLLPPLGAEAEGIFAEAAAAARAVLAKTTIADVVERENQAAGATMYYI